jgi:hypothetical protein
MNRATSSLPRFVASAADKDVIEWRSSQPSHGVGRGSRVTVRSAFAFDECSL